jgi:hypothetical protein
MQVPFEDHPQFEAICAHVGDWEPLLPTVGPELPERDDEPEVDEDEHTARLDGMILAGLVSP